MKKELPTMVIFYNLDLSTWNSLSFKKLDILDNFEIVKAINHVYYEYQHLSRKVDIQFQTHYSTLLAMSNYNQIRQSIVSPILAHIDPLIKESKELSGRISAEIKADVK